MEIQVKAILGTGAKRDDFKWSNMQMMSAEAPGADAITGRQEEGDGNHSGLEGCLFLYGKEKTGTNQRPSTPQKWREFSGTLGGKNLTAKRTFK